MWLTTMFASLYGPRRLLGGSVADEVAHGHAPLAGGLFDESTRDLWELDGRRDLPHLQGAFKERDEIASGGLLFASLPASPRV